MAKKPLTIKLPTQAAALKKIRFEANLSLRKFAHKLNIQETRLHRLECGQVEITVSEYHKLIQATKYDPLDIHQHMADVEAISTYRKPEEEDYDA